MCAFKKRERPEGCTCADDPYEFDRYLWEEIQHQERSAEPSRLRLAMRETDKDDRDNYRYGGDVKKAVENGTAPTEEPPPPPKPCPVCQAIENARNTPIAESSGPGYGEDFGDFLHGKGQYRKGGNRRP